MIIVDSGTWAEYFNGVESPHVDYLERALEAELDLAVLPIIVTEVLQGFRSEEGFRRARALLIKLPIVAPTLDTHVQAAVLFRSLRARGITVRGAVDCIIAQASIDTDSELLSPDVDFVHISSHSRLRLVSV
jgi:predicted nucleic acid-binding protein